MRFAASLLAVLAAFAAPAAAQSPEAAPPEAARPEAPAEPDLVWMGTGNVAGVYYPVGVALCRLVNQHRRDTNLRCAARPSEGSVGNLTALGDRTFDLAIIQSDTQEAALAGTGVFAAAGPDAALRSVASLYAEPLTVVARADAGIARVEDLAGKRVAWGAPGSGTRPIADALMAALGWSAASFAATPELTRTGWRTRSAPARSTPSPTPWGTRRWSCRRPPPPATPYSSTSPARRWTRWWTPACVRAGDDPGRPLPRQPPRGSDLRRGRDAGHPGRRARGHGLYRGPLGLRRDRHAPRPRSGARQPRPRAMARDGLAAPLHPGAARYFRERGWVN